jgi:hypothetical protein
MSEVRTIYQDDGLLRRAVISDPRDGFFGTFTTAASMDCTSIVEENKALREAQTGKETFRLMARIPVTLYEKAIREGWANDERKWQAWLNDPDNRMFRVDEGRV